MCPVSRYLRADHRCPLSRRRGVDCHTAPGCPQDRTGHRTRPRSSRWWHPQALDWGQASGCLWRCYSRPHIASSFPMRRCGPVKWESLWSICPEGKVNILLTVPASTTVIKKHLYRSKVNFQTTEIKGPVSRSVLANQSRKQNKPSQFMINGTLFYNWKCDQMCKYVPNVIVVFVLFRIKVKSSYIAQYPVLRIAQLTLHFTPWQTPSQFLWEAFSHAAINAWRLFVQISTTVYSQVLIHIHLPMVSTPQHRIQTRVLLVDNPKLYHWATAW